MFRTMDAIYLCDSPFGNLNDRFEREGRYWSPTRHDSLGIQPDARRRLPDPSRAVLLSRRPHGADEDDAYVSRGSGGAEVRSRPGDTASSPRWWQPTRRVGEAENPGPGPTLPDLGAEARKIQLGADGDIIRYPTPGDRHTSMEVVTAGHKGTAPNAAGGEKFQLVVETANTTGWSQLKRRLEETSAHVLLAQETWVLQASVPAASAWAKARGWRSVWAPATCTKRGGTSAGVAIFARDFMGLHPKPGRSHVVHPARVVAAVLEAPAQREMLLMSCYLKHGRKAGGENATVLANIEAEVEAHGQEEVCVIGGTLT